MSFFFKTSLLQRSWRDRIVLALVVWLVAEAAALMLVVKFLGIGGALLLGVATSLVGTSMLKRLGRSAWSGLQAGPAILQGPAALDGVLAGLSAIFLLLPGFLSDLAGLVLAVPRARQVVTRWISGGGIRVARGRPRAQHGPATIDLEPGDWRPGDDAPRPIR